MKRLLLCIALAAYGLSMSAQTDSPNRYLKYRWKSVPASAYLQFAKTGDAELFKGLTDNIAALNALIESEVSEKQGRYIFKIVDGVYYFSNMPAWINPAVDGVGFPVLPDPDRPVVTDTSVEIASLIDRALQLFGSQFDEIDPMIVETARRAIEAKGKRSM